MPRPQQPRGEVSGTDELASDGDRQDNAKPQPDWPVEDADRSPASSEATPPQPSSDGADDTASQQKTASATAPGTNRQETPPEAETAADPAGETPQDEAEQSDADQDRGAEQGDQAAENSAEEQHDPAEDETGRSSAQRSETGAAAEAEPSADADDAGEPAEQQGSEEDRPEQDPEPADAGQQSADTGASGTAKPDDTAEQAEEPAEESGAGESGDAESESAEAADSGTQPAAGQDQANSGAEEGSSAPAAQPDSDTEQQEAADVEAPQREGSSTGEKAAEEKADSAEPKRAGTSDPERAGTPEQDEPRTSDEEGAETAEPEQDGEPDQDGDGAPRQDEADQQGATEQSQPEEQPERGGAADAESNAPAKSRESSQQPAAAEDASAEAAEKSEGDEPEGVPEDDSSTQPEAEAPEESADDAEDSSAERKTGVEGETGDQEAERQDAVSSAAEDSRAEEDQRATPQEQQDSSADQREDDRADEQQSEGEAESTPADQQTDQPAAVAEQSPGEPAEQEERTGTGASAADDGETTQVIPRVVVAEPPSGEQPTADRGAPPVTDAEQTQQLAPVTVPEETDSERTVRLDLRELQNRELQNTDPSGFRAPEVQQGGEQPHRGHQQVAAGAPRAASPEDFAGVLRSRPTPPTTPAQLAQSTPPVAPPTKPRQPSVFAGQQAPQPQLQIPARLRRRRGLLLGAVALVALLVAGVAVIPGLVRQAMIADPPDPVQLEPSIKPLSADAPAPGPAALANALADELANPALGQLGGIVLDPVTDQVLWQRNADQGLLPGSTGKLLTAGAVLLSMDHQKRFTTKVVRGSTPGSIVIVGGGDPTLTTLPEGQESVYPGAARLSDLIEQVKEAVGDGVVSVQVDTSRYAGPKLAPGWLPQDIPAGYIAPIEPVMLDGGRQDPQLDTSPRSQTPALDVAKRVAAAFGATQVSEGKAPQNAEVLGEVQSPTVRELTEAMLQHSDNVLAETLAREVAIANGNAPTFEGATEAIRQVLQRNGIELGGTSMVDGSGLSLDDRTSSKVLGNLLEVATEPASPEGGLPEESAKLRALLPGLPVAGGTGSLVGRFTDAPGKGWVRAKTGTLEGANSLAGVLVTADGRLLVFALISNGTSKDASRAALDDLVSAIQQCGCR